MRVSVVRALAVVAVVAGCQAAPRPQRSVAASTACRAEVDRVYAAQNRIDLSLRDQRDTPFAEGYNSGITSRGLSAAYTRSNQYESCLNNASAPAPGPSAGPSSPGGSGSGTAMSPIR